MHCKTQGPGFPLPCRVLSAIGSTNLAGFQTPCPLSATSLKTHMRLLNGGEINKSNYAASLPPQKTQPDF